MKPLKPLICVNIYYLVDGMRQKCVCAGQVGSVFCLTCLSDLCHILLLVLSSHVPKEITSLIIVDRDGECREEKDRQVPAQGKAHNLDHG